MQYSDTVNKQGIVEAGRDYCSATAESYPIAQVTRNANKYYKRAISLIQKVDKKWRWDDNNATDLPIETTNLISGQNDYTLDSDVRDILRVEVLDETGEVWTKLRPIYESSIDTSIQEMFSTNSTPQFYELIGESLYLYPASDYSETNGLKIYEKKAPSLFVATDTTKEPGFDSNFHDYIALGIGYEYARAKKQDSTIINGLRTDILEMERDMTQFYGRRGGMAMVTGRNRLKV